MILFFSVFQDFLSIEHKICFQNVAVKIVQRKKESQSSFGTAIEKINNDKIFILGPFSAVAWQTVPYTCVAIHTKLCWVAEC